MEYLRSPPTLVLFGECFNGLLEACKVRHGLEAVPCLTDDDLGHPVLAMGLTVVYHSDAWLQMSSGLQLRTIDAAKKVAEAFEGVVAALVDGGGKTLWELPFATTAGFPPLVAEYAALYREFKAFDDPQKVRRLQSVLTFVLHAKAREQDPAARADLEENATQLRAKMRRLDGGAEAVEAADAAFRASSVLGGVGPAAP